MRAWGKVNLSCFFSDFSLKKSNKKIDLTRSNSSLARYFFILIMVLPIFNVSSFVNLNDSATDNFLTDYWCFFGGFGGRKTVITPSDRSVFAS
jgi:hypothetical protein